MTDSTAAELLLGRLCIGCWSFGGGDYWGDQSQQAVDAVVNSALSLGVNLFDTAEAYNEGRSEESLGRALGKKRNHAVVISKMMPSSGGIKEIVGRCEASLRRLNTEWIDIYLLHWPLEVLASVSAPGLSHESPDDNHGQAKTRIEDVVEGMNRLIQQGKIRFAGVSNFGIENLNGAGKTGWTPSVNQMMYNLLCRAGETDVLPSCRERGIRTMGYMPLFQGLLSGKFRGLDDVPELRRRTRHFSSERTGTRHGGPGFEAILDRTVKDFLKLTAGFGVDPAAAALAWTLDDKGVDSAVVGVRSPAQLEGNFAALELLQMRELMQGIDQLSTDLKNAMGSNIDYWESEENARSR